MHCCFCVVVVVVLGPVLVVGVESDICYNCDCIPFSTLPFHMILNSEHCSVELDVNITASRVMNCLAGLTED